MKTQTKNIIEFKVKSRTEQLAQIREFISKSANQIGIKQNEIDKIILAVDEACTNIIKHAYHFNPEKEITIILAFNSEEFKITLIDEGDSFNPNSISNPDMKKYFEEKRVGGLGLHLMRTLMDNVEYKTIDGKLNKLILRKKIKS